MKKISLLKFLPICRMIVYMVKERNQISLMKISLVQQTKRPEKSWHPLWFHGIVLSNLFFVSSNGNTVNKENCCRYLRKELFPAREQVVKLDDWIFAQGEAPSHRSHLEQDFLKTKLKRHFIRCEEWPPSSLNVNPLDYFCWGFVKTKDYEWRSGKLFASEAELKNKIKSVWNIGASDLLPLRKAIKGFVPRMKAVEEK